MGCTFHVVLLTFISIYANVFGIENLTFYGQYVVFKPKTQFIKFDLLEEIDIVLLEHRTNKPNAKLRPTDYLYRIRLIVDDSVTTEVKVNCTIQRKGGSIMVEGHYQFWNETEKNNMAVSWRSEKRIIEVLTEFEGNHNNIFSWKDRSKNLTTVRYIGLAVAPASSGTNHTESNHRHLNWKIREAEPSDGDIRNAYNMCTLKLLSGDPGSKSSNVSVFYQISVTREENEKFLVSLQKRNDEVLRAMSSRMDCKKLVISWDAKDKVVCFGLKNDTAPIFLWQDTEDNGYDYNDFKYVTFTFPHEKRTVGMEVKMEQFLTIADLFPRYFTGKLSNTARKSVTMSTTVAAMTVQQMNATTEPVTPSSGQSQQDRFGSADQSYLDKS